MAESGIRVEGEDTDGGSLAPQINDEKIIERAESKGWAPIDKWRGAPEDWVDAKEFLGRQKLYDKIGDLKSQIHQQSRKTQEDMARISKHFADMRDVEYKRALKDLQAQKELAIDDRNSAAVTQIDREINTIQEEQRKLKEDVQRQEQQAQKTESSSFVKWREDNDWFDKDTEMREDAIAIGVGYSAAKPGTSEQAVYEYVTKRIKKMYPERFEGAPVERKDDLEDGEYDDEPKPKRKAPSVEGGGLNERSAPGRPRTRKLTAADLSEDERQVMRTLIRTNTLKDAAAKNKRSQEEEYLAQLAAVKGH